MIDVEIVELTGGAVAAKFLGPLLTPSLFEEPGKLFEVMGLHVLLNAIGAEAGDLAAHIEMGLIDRIAQRLAGIAADDDTAAVLRKLDGFLCELKDMQIRDGLHIFGEAPSGEQEIGLLLALTRMDNPGLPSLRSSIATTAPRSGHAASSHQPSGMRAHTQRSTSPAPAPPACRTT